MANEHIWEVSIKELEENGKKTFKVTKRLPNMTVAETKIFDSRKKAEQQFNEWLKEHYPSSASKE